ncbi:MAG: hypothetical protein ACYTFY_05045 [Planctomycetota bacterium]|jgi:hypothetical protein
MAAAEETSISNEIMDLERIDDLDVRLSRYDAFWNNSVIDRPLTLMSIQKDPVKAYQRECKEDWLDADRVIERSLAAYENTICLADTIPSVTPNLGPDFVAAVMGCELEFGNNTSWSKPFVSDWNTDRGKVGFSEDNYYWNIMNELTDALLEAGRNKFYTGITDLHSSADTIAGFRDPLYLNMDMIDCPATIKQISGMVTDTYLSIYEHFYNKLRENKQLITSWLPLMSTDKSYIPSNDFSCMISPEMFRDVFLPELEREVKYLEKSIYHLDGPDALVHLDDILEIKELNAVQWVYGAGNGTPTDWIDVYKKIQASNKGIQLNVSKTDLAALITELKPEGVFLSIMDVKDKEEAEAIIAKLKRWK